MLELLWVYKQDTSIRHQLLIKQIVKLNEIGIRQWFKKHDLKTELIKIKKCKYCRSNAQNTITRNNIDNGGRTPKFAQLQS